MKTQLNRIVAMVILVLLIFPMLTFNTYAIEYSDVLSEDTREVLKILSIYGLMEGHDSQSFRPGNCVTKAEMAKIATVLLGYDDFSKGMESRYPDAKGHWAERYVDLVDELDILKAKDDDTYEPNKYLTYTETIIVILKVLGYNDATLFNNSDDSYTKLAKDLGLLKNINNPSPHYMTRESLAHLIHNALFTNTVEIKNNEFSFTGKTLINNIGKKASEKIDDVFALKHSYIDLSDYLLNVYDVYYDINEKILLIEKPLYKTIEGNVVSAVSTNIIFLSDRYNNKTTYNLSYVPFIFNGVKTKVTNEDLKNSYIKLIMDYNDESERIVGAVAYKITDKVVIGPGSLYKEGDLSFAGKILPSFENKISLEHVMVTGDATNLYDIQEDDLVYFYETKENAENKSTLKLNVIRKYTVGNYENRGMASYKEYFTISSQNYKLSSDFREGDTLSLGDKIKAILDSDDKIIEVKILEYKKEPENYGVVVDVNNSESNQLPIITIINKQGKAVSFELRENSGEVSKEIVNRSPKYNTALNKGDFIKYDIYDSDSIKIIKKIDSTNILSNYNSKTGTFSNQTGSINTGTTIVQLINNKYEKLNRYSLKNYIEGKAAFNVSGVAEIFVIDKNYTKTTGTQAPASPTPEIITPIVTPPVISKFTGSIYGVIQTISGETGSEKAKLFNFKTSYSVDKNLNKDLKGYKNQFIKCEVVNNIIVDITAYSAEISKSKVTAIYSGQLQIDGISFVEYAKNVLVFTCNYDSSGNITSFSTASISDIKLNSSLKFYNINKNYNGVMDVILIYN
jgi:hypothetical protein